MTRAYSAESPETISHSYRGAAGPSDWGWVCPRHSWRRHRRAHPACSWGRWRSLCVQTCGGRAAGSSRPPCRRSSGPPRRTRAQRAAAVGRGSRGGKRDAAGGARGVGIGRVAVLLGRGRDGGVVEALRGDAGVPQRAGVEGQGGSVVDRGVFGEWGLAMVGRQGGDLLGLLLPQQAVEFLCGQPTQTCTWSRIQ